MKAVVVEGGGGRAADRMKPDSSATHESKLVDWHEQQQQLNTKLARTVRTGFLSSCISFRQVFLIVHTGRAGLGAEVEIRAGSNVSLPPAPSPSLLCSSAHVESRKRHWGGAC